MNYLNELQKAIAEDIRKRRYPYLCKVCGTRAGHNDPHLTRHGEMCHNRPVWDCDQPEPKVVTGC